MKKATLIIFTSIIVLIIFKLAINRYFYRDTFLWPSRSYADALNTNVVVAEYNVKEIDKNVIDSLKKYNYYNKTFENKYWIEKQSREFPKYLFFKERILSKENYIRYNDLIISNCEDWRNWLSDTAKTPMIILSLDDSLSINEVRREEYYYKKLNSELLPYQVTLHVFFKRPKDNSHQSYINNVTEIANNDFATEYLGKIILTELENLDNHKKSPAPSI